MKAGQLRPKLPEIVRELESEAVTIAKLVEEGEKEAEIRRREWEAQAEKWQREEDERRRIQGIKDSREHLFGIIEAWGVATRIEGFFEDIERRAADLAADERQSLLERVRVARLLVGGVDALQRFSVWQGPERL